MFEDYISALDLLEESGLPVYTHLEPCMEQVIVYSLEEYSYSPIKETLTNLGVNLLKLLTILGAYTTVIFGVVLIALIFGRCIVLFINIL